MSFAVLLLFSYLAFMFYVLYIVAKKFEKITIQKGYSIEETHSFAMVFWLGILGMLYVIALPNKNVYATQQKTTPYEIVQKNVSSHIESNKEKLQYECSICKAPIEYGAEKCNNCDSLIDWNLL